MVPAAILCSRLACSRDRSRHVLMQPSVLSEGFTHRHVPARTSASQWEKDFFRSQGSTCGVLSEDQIGSRILEEGDSYSPQSSA